MNTEELIRANKARFNLNYQKLQLKEKYSAKLIFADQGGLWLAGPELFTILQFFTVEEVVLIDNYGNPVKVNKTELWDKASKIYATVMDEWYKEYEELKNLR